MKYLFTAFCLLRICFLLQAQALETLDINNIIATVSSNGELFKELKLKTDPDKNLMNSTSLWMGGLDPAGALHFAGQTDFSKGHELFYGPIDQDYKSFDYDLKYNKVWKLNKTMIEDHKKNFNKPGYVMPKEIREFPQSNFDKDRTFTSGLFLFEDLNHNLWYEPELGEYPIVLGDQCIYFILNDTKEKHSVSQGDPLGFQILGMLWGYQSSLESVNQTIYLTYKIINKSNNTYHNFYIGLFSDMNSGDPGSNYVGFDIPSNSSYTYSANSNDPFFGKTPPVISLMNMGNSLTYINDRHKNWFISYTDPISTEALETGSPGTVNDYYNYLSGRWKDGSRIATQGTGYNPGSSNLSNFLFTGDPNDSNPNWNEVSANNKPGNRKSVQGIGPSTIEPGQIFCLNYAISVTRDVNGDHISGIKKMKEHIQEVQDQFNNPLNLFCAVSPKTNTSDEKGNNRLQIVPNPASHKICIKSDDLINGIPLVYRIFSTTGQLVDQAKLIHSANLEIDISDVPAGMYYLALTQGVLNIKGKILIMK